MAASRDENDHIEPTLWEQRKEFTEAKTPEADLDFAFEVQMQEAVATSLALRASGSESPPSSLADIAADDESVLSLVEALLLSDVERCAQEREDSRRCEVEMRREAEDLRRRIHDQHVANEILSLPEEYWAEHGDLYQKPYGDASSSSSANQLVSDVVLRLYFKGLVSDEMVRDMSVAVAGAGIAICDPRGNLLFHSRKNLEAINGGRVICSEAAELEALLEGFDKALAFGFKRIAFFCENETLYHYVTNKLVPEDRHTASLLDQVVLLQRSFTYCEPSLMTSDKIKFAFKSAREAIVSQITWSEETRKGEILRETCIICLDDTDVAEMFAIDGCLHRYCFSCMKRHVEAKLHNGMIAKCPHDGCNSEVAIDSCAKFLPPNLVEVMGQRIKESAIPITQKIYCPDPKCSALMSKDEVLTYTKTCFVGADNSGARKCVKCRKFFCMDCRVPWHYDMSCDEYKRRNPEHHRDEQMLESLARHKLWRKCAKCNHMVELLEGCYHITCRCGYEFCYTCGAEWKNKIATCACPMWDERNIIRDDRPRRQRQPQAQQRQQQPQAQPRLRQRQPQAQPRRQHQPQQRQRQQQPQAQVSFGTKYLHRLVFFCFFLFSFLLYCFSLFLGRKNIRFRI